MSQLAQLTVAARLFALAGALGLAVLAKDGTQLFTLFILIAVALTATYLVRMTVLPTLPVIAGEALTAGLVIALSLPNSLIFLPYFVALTLVAGLLTGWRGVALVLFSGTLILTSAAVLYPPPLKAEWLRAVAQWALTAVASGALGGWLRTLRLLEVTGVDPPYEAAYRLLAQLRTVARRLSSGLDSPRIAHDVSDRLLRSSIGVIDVAVYARGDAGHFIPVHFSGDSARDMANPGEMLPLPLLADMEPQLLDSDSNGFVVAIPLRAGSRLVGIVAARVAQPPQDEDLRRLSVAIEEDALRLDAAMAFEEVRSIATQEERQRLAREIHDGVAQEVASLGYLVDDVLLDTGPSPHRASLLRLRTEITRIVDELRLSIYDLRIDVIRETGLGTALSNYVRQVGTQTDLTVHLTLDEGPVRLHPYAEAELLRIAQEAITNARKHAHAKNLWVTCRVAPPTASLTIRDDGDGLHPKRSGAYGLDIMRERASRLGATFDIVSCPGELSATGTVVTVTIEPPGRRLSQAYGEGHGDGKRPLGSRR